MIWFSSLTTLFVYSTLTKAQHCTWTENHELTAHVVDADALLYMCHFSSEKCSHKKMKEIPFEVCTFFKYAWRRSSWDTQHLEIGLLAALRAHGHTGKRPIHGHTGTRGIHGHTGKRAHEQSTGTRAPGHTGTRAHGHTAKSRAHGQSTGPGKGPQSIHEHRNER